jgi:hypothetical protein
VIVEGIQKVRPGMAVAVSEGPPVRPAGQTALQPKVPGRTKTKAQFAFGTGKVIRFEVRA